MEIRGRRFESLERVVQSNKFGLVGLVSLTDRRESVGTEDGGEMGEDDAQLLGRDKAPSNVVISRGAPQSMQLSSPPTPAEALARAQLLLDFPPAVEKLGEWRATIQSLVGMANKDELRPSAPVEGVLD